MGRHEHVLNNLHHYIYKEYAAHEQPEVVARFGGAQEGQDEGGHYADYLQIGHKTNHADKYAQTYGHGESDEQEAYREHNAVAQGNEKLPTEIATEIFLEVGHHPLGRGAAMNGDKLYPTLGIAVEVEHQEEEVQQGYHRSTDIDNRGGGAHQHVPEAGHHTLESRKQTAAAQESLHLGMLHGALKHFAERLRNRSVAALVFQIASPHALQVATLVEQRRHYQPAQQSQHARGQNDGQQHARQAKAQPTRVLEEIDNGVQHIGQQPRHYEGQQHGAEIVQSHEGAHYQQQNQEDSGGR